MRIGLLGAARITPKAIVQPASVIPTCSLQGVAARDSDRARAFAEKYGVNEAHQNYDALIEDENIDLIYNALPINLHASWSIKALEAGKHVLCEKPFAMNIDEAQAMLAAAEKSGRRIIEAFHYRYHPGFIALLDWISSGEIGAVRSIEAHFNAPIKNTGREIRHMPETGGGAMMDLGCYPLNWVLQITGAVPVSVDAAATLTPAGVDESMKTSLAFEKGVTAYVSTSMALDSVFSAKLKVVGEAGEITLDNPLQPHMSAVLSLNASGKTVTRTPSNISTYTYQLGAVLGALRAGERTPTEGDIILRQQQAIDDIYAAAGLTHLRHR